MHTVVNQGQFVLNSYSQEGEDMLLGRIFEYRPLENVGFYVDIGGLIIQGGFSMHIFFINLDGLELI